MADLYPWYPWYAAKWLSSSSARSMTLEQRGLYRELLDHQWREGSLPNDEGQLQRLGGASDEEWARAWPAVSRKFVKRKGGLVNLRLEEIRREQKAKAEAFSKGAQHAANARWGKAKYAARNA